MKEVANWTNSFLQARPWNEGLNAHDVGFRVERPLTYFYKG